MEKSRLTQLREVHQMVSRKHRASNRTGRQRGKNDMSNLCDKYYTGLFTPLETTKPNPFPNEIKYGRLDTGGLIIMGWFGTATCCKTHNNVPEMDIGMSGIAISLVIALVVLSRTRKERRHGVKS